MLCKNVVYFNINPFRDYLDSLTFIVPFSHESAGKSAINSICCMLINGFCLICKRALWYVDWGSELRMRKTEAHSFFFKTDFQYISELVESI